MHTPLRVVIVSRFAYRASSPLVHISNFSRTRTLPEKISPTTAETILHRQLYLLHFRRTRRPASGISEARRAGGRPPSASAQIVRVICGKICPFRMPHAVNDNETRLVMRLPASTTGQRGNRSDDVTETRATAQTKKHILVRVGAHEVLRHPHASRYKLRFRVSDKRRLNSLIRGPGT